MSSSDSEAPEAPDDSPADASSEHDEAQRAADGLKSQIAALRAKVKTAQDHLRPPRPKEPRSFED